MQRIWLAVCMAYAIVTWPRSKTAPVAGPGYDALYYYAKLCPKDAEYLAEKWYPTV
jgi:hypothetical protein